MRNDPVLSKLLILNVPRATNFLLSQAEAMRIAAVVRQHGEMAPAPLGTASVELLRPKA